MKNYYADVNEWFKDHVAVKTIYTSPDGKEIISIRWGKPDCCFYLINYLIQDNKLFISGDLGEAVHAWSGNISLNFLKGLSLDYYAEKCEACEFGRNFESWNVQYAKDALDDYLNPLGGSFDFEDFYEEKRKDENSFIEDLNEKQKLDLVEDYFSTKFDVSVADIYNAVRSQQEWIEFLNTNDGLFDYEYYDIGMIVDLRCHSHLVGLKLAIKQLESKENEQCKNFQVNVR